MRRWWCWLADRVVNAQIDNQKARNDYITKNIRELDKQVEEIKDLQRKRNQLIDRMRVIQELQGNRPIIVRVLDQLVRTVPDGVFLHQRYLEGQQHEHRWRRGVQQPGFQPDASTRCVRLAQESQSRRGTRGAGLW
jgi:hypothetical protein